MPFPGLWGNFDRMLMVRKKRFSMSKFTICLQFIVTIQFYNIFSYDVCGVTLSVYPHRASLKNMPGHGGNRTYDLWNTSPMLCQLSYAVRTVRVSDISEQNLVPSIPV